MLNPKPKLTIAETMRKMATRMPLSVLDVEDAADVAADHDEVNDRPLKNHLTRQPWKMTMTKSSDSRKTKMILTRKRLSKNDLDGSVEADVPDVSLRKMIDRKPPDVVDGLLEPLELKVKTNPKPLADDESPNHRLNSMTFLPGKKRLAI